MDLNCNILDHGDDPGRYTIIWWSGLIVTCNANGQPVFRRKCHNPHQLVYELRRERGVGLLKPSKNKDLIRKVTQFLLHSIR